ncbi:MAG: sulfur carrier protein ThiS [Verrucomicrobiota bacterium]|nr:sulfur carrier protein ThiS [Verrucomicrobiota bacterium]
MSRVITNGKELHSNQLPCALETFLLEQGFQPRSVVVELNGRAIAPSEFGTYSVKAGDRLEVVRVVAGG